MRSTLCTLSLKKSEKDTSHYSWYYVIHYQHYGNRWKKIKINGKYDKVKVLIVFYAICVMVGVATEKGCVSSLT